MTRPTVPITVVIPTIPPRSVPGGMLERTLASIEAQTVIPEGGVEVELDTDREGGAATRNRALARVKTPLVAFFDDDDLMMPEHLEKLYRFMIAERADYVYSWFVLCDEHDRPIPDHGLIGHFGKVFDVDHPHLTTIVTLVTTELAQGVRFRPGGPEHKILPGMGTENVDWQFTLDVCGEPGLRVLGRRPVVKHLAERTWFWRHWGRSTPGRPLGNTSGIPSSW